MHRNGYKPARFKSEKLHWIAANGWTQEMRNCLLQGYNPYQPLADTGLTPLHAAVANGSKSVVELLLQECYERDLKIAREEMRSRFLWKVENLAWTKRPMLIAHTEAECRAAKSLQCASPAEVPLNVQVFVFLRIPIDGLQLVALDVRGTSRAAKLIELITSLLPNGNLSLDIGYLGKKVESCLQLACYNGNLEILELLIRNGARLSVGGIHDRIPLMTACEYLKMDIVQLLLTKYSEHFDPTVYDDNDRTALHVALEKGNVKLVELIMDGMIKYRMRYHKESASVAFNYIFRYENEDLSSISIWYYARAKVIQELCVKYAVQYQLDITYRCRNVSNFECMVCKELAMDYLYAEVCRRPEVLEQDCYLGMNNLHFLMTRNRLEFVKKLYRDIPSLKRVFEKSGAFEAMRTMLFGKHKEMLAFVFQHHREFLMAERESLLEQIINVKWFKVEVYGTMFTMFFEAFPELRDQIQMAKSEAEERGHKESISQQLYRLLRQGNVDDVVAELINNDTPYDKLVDENGCTLLHLAVQDGAIKLVEKLLNENFDWNIPDNEGNLPLHYIRKEEMFDLLHAKFPICPSMTNNLGYNLLHRCCKFAGEKHLLKKLISLGFDINEKTSNGHVPLSLATCCTSVRSLLDHNANIELIDPQILSGNLLNIGYCAAWALIPRIAQLEWFPSIAHVYLPWMVGNQNRDFFSCSCQESLTQHADIRKILFDSLYRHSKHAAEELFSKVCQRANNCCVGWFLDYNYDMDYEHRDDYAYTPLLGLLGYMEEPNLHLVKRLLEKGVNVNAVNERKMNALLLLTNGFRSAKWYGHSLESIKLLLDKGAHINAQDEDGNTALHFAFRNEVFELVQFLLENGADWTVRNNGNRYACEMGDSNSKLLYSFLRP